MWSIIRKFFPIAIPLLFWVGLQISGIVIPWLGYLLLGLTVLLLLIIGWSWVKRGFSYISRLRLTLVPGQSHKDVSTRFILGKDGIDDWTALIIDNAIVGQGFEFFPNRDTLYRHHTLIERVKSVPTVWAFWPTGTYASGVIDAIQSGNIKRLMLPHPEKSPIEELAALTGNKPEDIVNDIKRTARKALEKRAEQNNKQDIPIQDRIEVRWYLGMITNSIMLGNPEPLTEDSWVQVENLIPLKTDNRSSYALIYGQTPFQPLFVNVKTALEELWSQSIPTKDSDLQSPVLGGAETQELITERLVFIQKSRAVAGQLLKNSQGAQTQSVTSIIHALSCEAPVAKHTKEDTIAGQTLRLLTHDLDSLFSKTGNFQRSTEELSTTTLDEIKSRSICNITRDLILDYRRLVDESCDFLKNLESKGAGDYWSRSPWSVRIQRELADNYDELMRLVKDLRGSTPKSCQDLLPNDEQLRKFPRMSMYM